MPIISTAGAGFLLAVLWFDLMFDVQVLGHKPGPLPADTLKSIATYYRRVTTDAHPMSMLISATMLVTLASIGMELTNKSTTIPIAAASLGLVASAVGVAGSRTVKNAKRLVTQTDTIEEQSRLARQIYSDHRFCFATVSAALALQLSSAF